ncbi:unnamed protein product [Rangifer tarandus platyrhynchus]|uniref:Uncharacterized protein n=1 Tax=Rangifer tarandus platyrhynchus TaxID=3082113 RepID=A0ABN9A5S6_RANTA|nr:unnamed protein product [Rangifer tarandus platyrhynchus]
MGIYFVKQIEFILFCKNTFTREKESGISGPFGIKLGRGTSDEEGSRVGEHRPSLFHPPSHLPVSHITPLRQVPCRSLWEQGGPGAPQQTGSLLNFQVGSGRVPEGVGLEKSRTRSWL